MKRSLLDGALWLGGFLAWQGCGDDSARQSLDYPTQDEPSVRADAGWTPTPDLECEVGIACRGACLTELGQVANTCELLIAPEYNLTSLQRSGDFLVAVSSLPSSVIRIALDDFAMTPIVEADYVGTDLFVHDDLVFFETEGFVHSIPVKGGEVVRLADAPASLHGPTRYAAAAGYLYVFGAGAQAVVRVPVRGGEPEAVVDEPDVPWFAATGDHYVYVADVPQQGPYRAHSETPARRSTIELVDWDSPFGVYASLHTWPADPGAVYALSRDGYARIDAATGDVDALLATDLFNLWPTQTSEHLATFFTLEDGLGQLRVADWQTGHVEVIDQKPFDGIAEDDTHYYVTRDGGLLRFPK